MMRLQQLSLSLLLGVVINLIGVDTATVIEQQLHSIEHNRTVVDDTAEERVRRQLGGFSFFGIKLTNCGANGQNGPAQSSCE